MPRATAFVLVLLSATILVLPWWYGGATAIGHFGLALSVAIGSWALCCSRLSPRAPPTALPLNLVIVLSAGVLLGIGQLLPLAGIDRYLAPTAHRWRAEMQLDEADGTPPIDTLAVTTRSIYPAATRHCVGLMLAASGACLLAMFVFGGRSSAIVMLVIGTTAGVAISIFGIVEGLQGVAEPYGSVTLTTTSSIFGPYVNRNNAGGFLNLCLACAVGLVARMQAQPSEFGRGRNRNSSHPASRANPLLELTSGHLLVWTAVVIITAGVFATVSRGSVVAFIFASIITFILVRPWAGRGVPVWVLFGLVAGALCLAAWLGPLERVQKRFDDAMARDSDAPLTSDGRLANWKEALAAWPDFALWGSGLETYGYAYLRHQQREAGTKIHYHAENQLVQTLCDAGIIGFGLLVAAIWIFARYIQQLARSRDRVHTGLAVAGTFALVSQLVGGSFDFGLYLPANALLMAVICGSVCGRASARGGQPAESTSNATAQSTLHATVAATDPMPLGGLLQAGLLALVGLGSLLAAWDFYHLSRIERLTHVRVMEDVTESRDDQRLADQIQQLAAAVRWRADDADANHALAVLWMERFRLQLFNRFKQAQPWADADPLWEQTSSISLLAAKKSLRDSAADDHSLSQQIAALQPTLDVAIDYNARSIRHCPWDSRFHLLRAAIYQLMDERPATDPMIDRALKFAGGNPDLWFQCGLMYFLADQPDKAESAWDRAMQLSPSWEEEIKAWRTAQKQARSASE